MIDYTLILNYKFQGSEWILNGDDYAGLQWLSDSPKPSKATLDALWNETQTFHAEKAQAKIDAKAALLDRLGITADEAKLLIG
jgi:hypothetical protein